MKRFLWLLVLCSCAHNTAPAPKDDPYLWLEDIEGKEALQWVEKQNQESQALADNDQYRKMEADSLKILEAKDKIPGVYFQGKTLVNFWRDDVHVRGLVRKTTLANYKKKSVKWENVLDVDALSKKENENWIYKGMDCLPPEYQQCLVVLSRGGKDASVVREFDFKNKKFVDKGFTLPEAKSRVAWIDKDNVLVGTDFGPGSLTESGYPRQIKLWKRGTPMTDAVMVFEGQPKDVWVDPSLYHHGAQKLSVISRGIDFFNTEEYVFDLKKNEKQIVPKPRAAELNGYYAGQLIYKLRDPWNFDGKSYPAGAIVALKQESAGRELAAADVQLLLSPADNQSVAGVMELKTKLVVVVLEDVKSKLMTINFKDGKWSNPEALNLPGSGNISLAAGTDLEDLFLYYYESFNQASTLYSYDFKKKPELLKSLPDRFNAKDIVVEQKFVNSKDGTKVPYFLVYKKGTAFDGTAPTLQYGYGGFTVSQSPSYNALVGKLWLEKGGVYVVANIRGGGEYGPRWHQAALKENRQKAYDDFIAVSEDLIAKKITSPKHLAIRGGSNGGLLVGAVVVQRPDLYGGVLCLVPLLDMMRYSQLLAGASWMSEYGDPQDAKQREAILKYSPYQNVGKNKTYPPVFFLTSTKDDRVHPGHARKMAAKMKDAGHKILYYENTEGGHAASANFKQMAKMNALQFQFLFDTIAKKETKAKTATSN